MTTVKAAGERLEAALTRLEKSVDRRLAGDSVTQVTADLDQLRRELADLESRHQAMRQRYARAVDINAEIAARLDEAIKTVKTVVAE